MLAGVVIVGPEGFEQVTKLGNRLAIQSITKLSFAVPKIPTFVHVPAVGKTLKSPIEIKAP